MVVNKTSIMDLNATLNLLIELKVFEITAVFLLSSLPLTVNPRGLLNKVDMN